MKRVSAVIGLVLLAGSIPAAPPPAEAPTTPERLVVQLGSDEFEDREAAMAVLEKLGAAARPVLEQALRHPNPEVNKRAARLLVSLQRSADAAGKFDVKTVRLAYRKVPLGTAVNDLKSRTGINLTLDGSQIADPLRVVTCETGDLPPWEAVAAFMQAAGLKEVFEAELPVPKQERTRRGYYQPPPPPPSADKVGVILADGVSPTPPGSRSTAVRVLALPPSFPRHRVYLGSGNILFHFDVAPMPGYNWQSVSGVRITKVVDDADRIGAAGTNREPGGFMDELFDTFAFAPGGFGGGGAILIDGEFGGPTRSHYANPRIVPVPIRVATPNARKLKLLEGAVVCEVNVPHQPLATIPNLAMQIGVGTEGLRGTKLTVLDAKTGGKGGKAILKVQLDQPSPWLTNRFNPWGQFQMEVMTAGPASPYQVKGFDAAGKPVRMNSLTSSDSSVDELTQTTVTQYTCPDGLPVKIVLYGPKPVMVEVPFKMENVPLP